MTYYHLTGKSNFRLDPNFKPQNNTTWGGNYKPGIFVVDEAWTVGTWCQTYGYWQPWVVEFEGNVDGREGVLRGGYSGEVFIPAEYFDDLTISRVIPLDAFAREVYQDYGWTEEAFLTTFDTGEPIETGDWGLPKPPPWKGSYRYPGDARNEDSGWKSQYAARVRKFRGQKGSIAARTAATSQTLTAGYDNDPLMRMLDDDGPTDADIDAIVDLLGGPMTTYEPYTPPERPKFDPIPGVEPGWEEYALDLLDQEDRTHTAHLWLPTDVVWYYREYDRSNNTGQASAVEYALRQGGIRVPVLISTDGRDALLIEGNHRVMLARKLGIPSVPVRIQWDPSGVRANEGTPVPLEPVLEGWLRQNGRTASAAKTLYRGLSVNLPYEDMDADFILDYLEGHHPEGIGLGRHWSTDQQVAFRSVSSYGTGIVIGVRWDGQGADPERTNTRGDWPDEQEVTLLPDTPVRVVSLLVRDDSGRWEERLEVPEERWARKEGMSLVDVYLTYPHQPMDEQGRVLLWRGIPNGFEKFHYDPERSPSHWWEPPRSAQEALANILENWGPGFGQWWGSERIAKMYATEDPGSTSLAVGVWWNPDDVTRPSTGYEGVLVRDGAVGEIERMDLWTGGRWTTLGDGKGKSVTAVTDTEFLRGDPDLKDVEPGTVLYRGVRLPLDEPAMADVRAVLEEGGWRDPRLGGMLLDHMEGAGSGGYRLGRHWSLDKSIAKMFSGGPEQSSSPLTEGTLAVVLTARYGGTGGTFVGRDSYHYRESEVVLEPDSPVEITDVEVFAWGTPSSVLTSPQLRVAGMTTADYALKELIPADTEWDPIENPTNYRSDDVRLTEPSGTWYHVTSWDRFQPGDIVLPAKDSPYGAYNQHYYDQLGEDKRAGYVWVAQNLGAAFAWASSLYAPYIWEVHPMSPPQPWNIDGANGWVCDGARIVRLVSDKGGRDYFGLDYDSFPEYATASKDVTPLSELLTGSQMRTAEQLVLDDMPTRYEMPVSELYRGLVIYADQWGTDEIMAVAEATPDSPRLGPMILDWLEGAPEISGRWLGKHWSLDWGAANSFAFNGSARKHISVILTAHWNGNRLDREFTDRANEEYRWEDEIALQPGAQLEIVNVEVCRRNLLDDEYSTKYYSVLPTPQQRTAEQMVFPELDTVEYEPYEPQKVALFRGFSIDPYDDPFLTDIAERKAWDHPRLGDAILDYLESKGSNYYSWLGRHWSTEEQVAKDFSIGGWDDQPWHVVLYALWENGLGQLSDDYLTEGYHPDEQEITLLPGTPVEIHRVKLQVGENRDPVLRWTDVALSSRPSRRTAAYVPPGYQVYLFSTSGYGDGVAGIYPDTVSPSGTNWHSAISWDKYGKITNIDTKPAHQGKGLARALYEYVKETWRPDLMHDRSLSDDGRAWSNAVGGQPYDAAEYQRRMDQADVERKMPWEERERLMRERGWPQFGGVYGTVIALRHVRDEEYWGLPEGTPIHPGMHPEPQKDRAPVADDIPEDIEYEEAPKADTGPKLKVTPDMSEEEINELVEEFKKLPGKLSDYIDYEAMEDSLVAKYNVATPEQKEWGELWYAAGQEYIENVADKTGFSPHQVAAVVAAFSPRNPWDPNVAVATHFLMNWDPRDPEAAAEAFGPDDLPGLKENLARAKRVMQAEDDPDAVLDALGTHEGAPKIRNFYKNLMGDPNSVTIDAWMAKAMVGEGLDVAPSGFAGKVLGWGYDGMADAVRNVADRLGITPAALQATVWTQVNNTADYSPWTPETYRKKKKQREKAWTKRPFQKPIPDYEHGPAWDSTNLETGEPLRPAPTYKDSPALHWREPQPSVLTDKAAALLLAAGPEKLYRGYWIELLDMRVPEDFYGLVEVDIHDDPQMVADRLLSWLEQGGYGKVQGMGQYWTRSKTVADWFANHEGKGGSDFARVVVAGDWSGEREMKPMWQWDRYPEEQQVMLHVDTPIVLTDMWVNDVHIPLSRTVVAEQRYVRDSDYWGVPAGTPIEPGMKPKPQKDRAPVDEVPEDIEYEEMPEKTPDEETAPALEDLVDLPDSNGRWEYPHEEFRPDQYDDRRGTHRWGIHPTDAPATHESVDDFGRHHVVYYNPELTDVTRGEFRPQVSNPGNRLEDLQPKVPGMIWRGMSDEEWKAAQETGYFQSNGSYNFEGQEGATLFAEDPGTASNYASNFAPFQFMPTFTRPAHVIGVPDQDYPRNSVGEVEVPGRIPLADVMNHYRGDVVSVFPGSYDGFQDVPYGDNTGWKDAPYRGQSPTVNVQWSEAETPVEYEEMPEAASDSSLKDKIAEPSDDLEYEVDSTWLGNGFDSVKDGIRDGAMRALTEGYTGPPDGLTGWKLQRVLRDAKNPEGQKILGGELVARAVHSEPTTKALWRGAVHGADFVAGLTEGSSIAMPLSSFTPDYGAGKRYAQPSEENWSSGDQAENGVPVIYKLEPGAQVARIAPDRESNPMDEHVAFGEFEIVKVEPDTSWKGDGPTEITIRQTSLVPKSEWRYAARTAAAPQTLYRGLHIPKNQSPIPASWLKSNDAFLEHRYEMGPILLDAIQRGHWDYGTDTGTGIGRHWSTSRSVSERFAEEDERWSTPILLKAEWDGSGEDPDRTNVGGDFPGEQEITLLPGTPLRITGVFVKRGTWRKVLDGEDYRTADLKTAAPGVTTYYHHTADPNFVPEPTKEPYKAYFGAPEGPGIYLTDSTSDWTRINNGRGTVYPTHRAEFYSPVPLEELPGVVYSPGGIGQAQYFVPGETMPMLEYRGLSPIEAGKHTAAEPGGVLPYPASDYGYLWNEVDLDTYQAVTRDNLTVMTLVVSHGRQVLWTAEDDLGVIERGNFMWSTGNMTDVFDQANRLLSQFDTNPVVTPKEVGYQPEYREQLPNHFPEPDFREPWVPIPEYQ